MSFYEYYTIVIDFINNDMYEIRKKLHQKNKLDRHRNAIWFIYF